jgi:putative membrane protein
MPPASASRPVRALALRKRLVELGPPARRFGPVLLTMGLAFGMVAGCFLLVDLGRAVLRALPALPAAILIHLLQIAADAQGWRQLFHAPRPGLALMLRARWVRESLNGLLPLVGIGGGVLAGFALARQTGRPAAGVAAAATLDLLIESIMQLPFLVIGLVLFALLAPGLLPPRQAMLLLSPLLLTLCFALALRAGIGRAPTLRLAHRFGLRERLEALRGSLAVVNAGTLPTLRAGGWHFLAWCLGALEVWAVLWVLGTPVGLAEALAIESLGMAARSLGFALPAGLGAQEAGLAAVAVALGVPLEAAVAMAMLKRLREVLMNLPGLLAWQRWERQRMPRPAG